MTSLTLSSPHFPHSLSLNILEPNEFEGMRDFRPKTFMGGDKVYSSVDDMFNMSQIHFSYRFYLYMNIFLYFCAQKPKIDML